MAKTQLYESELSEAQPITFHEFPCNLDRILLHGSDALHNLVLVLMMAKLMSCGRTTMAKLVYYTLRIECCIMRVSRHYRGNDTFPATLKEMFNRMGIEGRCVLLLVEYYQLADETLLSYLKQLVITGDVIRLFEDKELGAPLAPIKELYSKQRAMRSSSLATTCGVADWFVCCT